MIPKKNDLAVAGLLQFSPYIIFLVTYISLYCYTLHTKNTYHSQAVILAGLPLFAAFAATIYAFFTFQESLKIEQKIAVFFSGVADIYAINAYFNIIFIAIFNHMLAKTNGILTLITLSLLYISTSWMMPILFLLSSFFAIMIPSLPAVIIICMPIGYGIAQSLQINCALMAATIISGALFGSHLSLHFNTFIRSKPLSFNTFFYKNLWIILGAAIITFIMLSQYQQVQFMTETMHNFLKLKINSDSFIVIIPYLFLLLASMLQINFLAILITSSCIALATEIIIHKIMFLDAISTIFNGFCKESMIVNILFLHMIIAGLTKIIKYNGGFHYIIEELELTTKRKASYAQGSIFLITVTTNLLIIIDTICFNLIADPIKKIGDSCTISSNTVSNLVHITITTMQAVVPYASIMMITINIMHTSYIEILHYMIYPLLITIFMIISMLFSNIHIKNSYHYHKINQ